MTLTEKIRRIKKDQNFGGEYSFSHSWRGHQRIHEGAVIRFNILHTNHPLQVGR